MRKLCAWLGAATLLLVCSIASADSGTALKPYVTLILDTSGSMDESTGFGSPTCGAHCSTHTNTLCTTSANCPASETCVAPADHKFFHAKCAIDNIANSYGDIVFALARYRANLGGAVSGEFPAGCTATPPACNAADNQFQLLSSLVDGGNSAAASWVNFTGNSCDGSGTDPEIWNDPSNTPLGGALLGAQRYYEGLQASDGTTTIWPSTSAGFDPILNDPTNSVFVGPTNCDPSATCTTNCCTSQCRPYITILLTDGQETCGGDAPTAAAGMFNYSNVHAIKINNITRSAANVVTVNTTSRHFLAVGDSVVIASSVRGSVTGNAAYNGTFTVATTTSTTRFTYTQTGGALAQATGGYAAKNDPIVISTIVRASNVVTVTTAATHTLQPGQSVVIAGVAGFNGTFVVLSATATTFTYAQTGTNGAGTTALTSTASHAALLYDYDIQTKVIGFGVSPGDAGIEAIAHGGGAPDVPLVNEGYYAADQAGLELAISDIIAKSVRSETCNNLDDDCDTRIDEDFPTKGADCTNNEKGVCLVAGHNKCRDDGTGVVCDAGTVDNPDCATQPDGTACTVTNAANATVDGKCSNSVCDPFLVQGTATEICNGLDDDCDGKIDEGLTGCTCSPQAELCNAADDNCDGHPDQTCTCSVGGATCKTGADCGAGSCVCAPLVRNCGTGTCLGTQTCGDTNGDGSFDTANGAWGACNAPQACIGTGPDCGICDGKDNDCDGVCDGFTLGCSDIQTPGGPSTDNPGDPTNSPIPQNICHPGQKSCPQSCAGTNSFSACSGEVQGCNPAQDGTVHCDLCDGLDNDCDNKIDEDFVSTACSSNCGVGMTVCTNGHITCDAMPATTDNTCDHIDDDCDGNFDEDWVCDSSVGCTGPNCCICGTGTTCEKTECINGVPTCTTTQPIDPEACNCLDDDCDGRIDEGALCGGGADCVNCQCAFRCNPGEFPCPLSKKCSADNYCINDPCFGVTCPDLNGSKQACKDNGNNTGSCVDICTVTTCADPLKCFPPTGECLPDDCTTYPDRCSATENCVAGVCVGNRCTGVTCPTDQYCESGNCINSCAGVDCPAGKRCRLGVCETDPCTHGCPYGKVCNDASGVCVDDPCTFRDCQKGQWCNPNDGVCEDDPCVGTACPDPSQVCRGGTCYDPSSFLPDAGIETHVTVGGGGCNTTGDGTSALFVLGVGLLLWRRPRRGARS